MIFTLRKLPVLTILAQCTRNVFGAALNYHSLATETIQSSPGGLYTIAVRHVIRNYFPRPSERKRIKRHGWNKRMATVAGQRILMRRMLKGKHVLTH